MAKVKNLKDIKINEVSMVDLPANKLPFLFFKQKDGKQIESVSKKKLNIEIESDGITKGTSVSIDGKSLGKLRDFNFSFWNTSKGGEPVSCSYSKVVEDEGGFKRTETFYLTKGKIMSKELLKALQEYLGTEDIDFEKKVSEEEILKAVTLINKEYKADFPEDLAEAVELIVKTAANSFAVEKEDVNKAGAKFSKDVIKKLKDIITAVEALKSILPDMKESTEKSDSDDTGKTIEELTKQIADLKEVITKGADDELKKTLETLTKQVEALEKGGVKKMSLTDQDDNDDDKPKGAGEDGKVLWPTLINQD